MKRVVQPAIVGCVSRVVQKSPLYFVLMYITLTGREDGGVLGAEAAAEAQILL